MIFGRRYTRLKDADLMVRVSEGDEGAFRELLRRHQHAVYGFALRLLNGDTQEAEDVAQETFLRLFRTSGRYRPTASLRTFLFRITKNLCIDRCRKMQPELPETLPEVADETTPLVQLEQAIETDRLEKAIETLPVNQRMALLLRYTEQMRYRQIADVMELSVGAVESLLVRARRNLHRRLALVKQAAAKPRL